MRTSIVADSFQNDSCVMDRADNRIARCRTLLCAPPIPLHDCHPHDCHLHDCHPERSEGPAFRDCLLYVRVPWISAAPRIHAACAVEAHGFSRGKGRCSSTGLQPRGIVARAPRPRMPLSIFTIVILAQRRTCFSGCGVPHPLRFLQRVGNASVHSARAT